MESDEQSPCEHLDTQLGKEEESRQVGQESGKLQIGILRRGRFAEPRTRLAH